MHLTTLLSLLGAAIYIAGGYFIYRRLRRTTYPHLWCNGVWLALAAAVLIHAWALFGLMFQPESLNFSFLNSASLIGLEIAIITLLASLRLPIMALGVVIFPIVGLSVIGAWLSPSQVMIPDEGWGLNTHIIVSLFAYSLISIGAVQALLLALQDYRLRHRKTMQIIGILPPLQVMERFMFQTIMVGFVLLSLSLFTGFWYLNNLFAQNMVEKTLLSMIAWCVFAVLLWGRWQFGWRGRTAISWTLGGFAALVLAYFGSKLLLLLVFGHHAVT